MRQQEEIRMSKPEERQLQLRLRPEIRIRPEETPMRRRRPEIPRLEERQLQRLLEVRIRVTPKLEEPLLQLLLSLLL